MYAETSQWLNLSSLAAVAGIEILSECSPDLKSPKSTTKGFTEDPGHQFDLERSDDAMRSSISLIL